VSSSTLLTVRNEPITPSDAAAAVAVVAEINSNVGNAITNNDGANVIFGGVRAFDTTYKRPNVRFASVDVDVAAAVDVRGELRWTNCGVVQ
jgi:hypothetical protein